MKNLLTAIMILVGLNVGLTQNAPVSTLGNVVTYESTAIVPITVTGFNDIGSCNMKLLYDPSIAICTNATKGAGVGGGYAANTDVPGIITLGWYSWPGIDLADNSVFFNLHFTMIDYGNCPVTWDTSYVILQWGDGSSYPLNMLPYEEYFIEGNLSFLTGAAPMTYSPDVTGVQGSTISVPITVVDFNNIETLNLTLNYNSTVIQYQSFTNDSGFPGLTIDGIFPGVVSAAGTAMSGIFLPDDAVLFTLVFNYNGGTTDLTWYDDGPSCEYEGYPAVALMDTPSEGFYFPGSVSEAIRLGIKVFLEGPFENGEMTTTLADEDFIPLAQAYNISPWNYDGLEEVTSIPANVVDWVLIELRETTGDAFTATADKMIAQKAGFLLKDGSVKDMDGLTNLSFPISPINNLFIVVYHRNHIKVISANGTSFFNGHGNYNFSTGEFQALGGSTGYKELTNGLWGLVAGDSNADGIIDESDKIDYWKPNAGSTGYLSSDFSMDSENNNIDKNNFWDLNKGFETQVPE